MSDDRPVQHTPKHLVDKDVFDSRHPAASSFAVAQPAAGVVADDVEERGQNLRGGQKASDAQDEYSDQKEVLAEQHADTLRRTSGVESVPAVTVKDGVATKDEDADKHSRTRASDKPDKTADKPADRTKS